MKCPECQTENPDTQKFCGECGARLEKTCPSCSAKNPPQYKFCGECGHDLTTPPEPSPRELSFDEKLDKIQRLKETVDKRKLKTAIEVDGGISTKTAPLVVREGATLLVAGSSVYNSRGTVAENIAALYESIQSFKNPEKK